MKQVMFGILYIPKNKLLGFSSSSNEDGEFCVSVEFSLDDYSENVWLVPCREQAERIIKENTPWYNAGYETPRNQFDAKDLKIVEIILEAK